MLNDIFWGNIVPYLSLKDLSTLKETCSYYYHNISQKDYEKSVLNLVIGRLKKIFGDKYDEFKKQMEINEGVIAGSFIVQCILEENWETDIDIFIPGAKYVGDRNGFKYIEKCGSYSLIEEYFFKNYGWYDTNPYGLGDASNNDFWQINYVRNYIIVNRSESTDDYFSYKSLMTHTHIHDWEKTAEMFFISTVVCKRCGKVVSMGTEAANKLINCPEEIYTAPIVQIVAMGTCHNKDDLLNMVRDTFDFDICKSTLHFEKGEGILNLECIEKVLKRKITCDTRLTDSTGKRVQKYEEREFEIDYK